MSSSKLVYSTGSNTHCPKCAKVLRKCRCPQTRPPARQTEPKITISRETKGRKGKGVTLIHGMGLGDKELKAVAKQLKTLCGSGGTTKDGIIEIQGDHRESLKTHLEKTHPKVVISGS
jgi:translation initiation factor 1